MYNGLWHMSVWGYILTTLLLTHITVVSVTLYLHRAQAHRAMNLHPVISHFFRFWLWFTTGQVTKEWIAIHRKHHAKCETLEDPHSPQILGIKKVLFRGYELYRKEQLNTETIERYGSGCPDDWIERHLYTRHNSVGIVILFLINVTLFGLAGVAMWAIQMAWIPFFAGGVINGIGHYWGYRNFECPDAARNIFPIGILTAGEELHNNHHTFGSSAKFSVKWWEFDLGWFYISILKMCHLVKIKKTIPKLTTQCEKRIVDKETLRVFTTSHLQVMSRYAHEVIVPVLEREKKRLSQSQRKMLAKAKTLLIREGSLLNEENKKSLSLILAEISEIEQVYQFRIKLQTIWTRTTASQKELIDALQDWCSQAEKSGIDALHQFAFKLKQLTL